MNEKDDPHSLLVKSLYIWIRERCDNSGYCYSVSVDHIGNEKPPVIISSVPDVYAITLDKKKVVIGEAETEKGLLDKHTENQIKDLIIGCSDYDDALLVIAVPWYMVARAKTIMKQLKKELKAEHVKTVVLEKLGI